MRATKTVSSLASLRKIAGPRAAELPQIARLEMIARLIEEECAAEVAWAVAYGALFERLSHGLSADAPLPRGRFEVLVVTTLDNIYDAAVALGERVFAPVRWEYGKGIEYHIWTVEEFEYAVRENHPIWRRITAASVSIYGAPDAAAAKYAKPGLS